MRNIARPHARVSTTYLNDFPKVNTDHYANEIMDWEAEAQDAACNLLCFALLPEGRLINADQLSSDCYHSGPYDQCLTLPDSLTSMAARKRKASRKAPAVLAMPNIVSTLPHCAASLAANASSGLHRLPVAA